MTSSKEPAVTRPLSRFRSKAFWMPVLPVALLVVLYLGIGVVEPDFLSITSAASVATQAAPLLFLAVGLTPVIILGAIDLSLAALTSLASVLLIQFVPGLGVGGLLLVLLICAGAGGLVGLVHAVGQIPSFVVTLGAFGLYTGLALQLSGANNAPLTGHLELVTWTTGLIAGIPASFVVAAAFAVVVWAAMRYLSFGRYTFAAGAREEAALMSGVRTVRLRVGLFALAGLSAGLAAIPLVGRTTYASPSLANTLLLPSIAAVVVGGTAISGGVGSALRTLVGALIVTVIEVGLVVVGVNAVLQNVVFGLVVIIAVALTTDRSKLPTIK